MIRLETPDLVLREFAPDDLAAVQRYASDPAVCRFMVWGPNTERETREFLEVVTRLAATVPRREFELAVTHRGELVGAAGIRLQGPRDADVGYVLRRDVWGRGFATQAASALIRFGFDALGLHRIWATCDVENGASARVLAKAGMTHEGRLRGHMLRQGAWRDSLLFAILEGDRRP